MIVTLRSTHRRVFTALGVLLPLVFVAGVAARKEVPQVESLIQGLSTSASVFAPLEFENDHVFSSLPIRVQLLREQDTKQLAVAFTHTDEILQPDLLVYWSAVATSGEGVLPVDARLLGPLGPGPLRLPDAVTTNPGRLILFSLADQRIIDTSNPIRISDPEQ